MPELLSIIKIIFAVIGCRKFFNVFCENSTLNTCLKLIALSNSTFQVILNNFEIQENLLKKIVSYTILQQFENLSSVIYIDWDSSKN